ncbi:MAG: polysaccharide pyruvyl transferase family protein [Clostridia bacterium]|nr:polysaccharide pyruvyl transferase family protein [Clostridia bacterium]
MKKIFVMAYARKNLGDDLFIKMLLDRYPMHQFYMKVNNCIFLDELQKQYENLNVIQAPDTDDELYASDVNEYDAYVYVGGSIFMEGGKVYNLSERFHDFIKRCKENNKPFCYISCNYGPYQTEEYFNLSRETFKNTTDICFRDKHSYNLFKDIKSVRYAPDFAFTYPIKKQEKIPDSVGITIIDLSIRDYLCDKEQAYIDMIVNNINAYIKDGKKVYLYTFCSYESDERTLEMVLKRVNNPNVVAIRYNGDIESFIDTYSKMEYMICARFHAIILSLLANQKIHVMSYSKKIDRIIDDLELNLPNTLLTDISGDLIVDLSNFEETSESKINDIKEKAQGQELAIKNALN